MRDMELHAEFAASEYGQRLQNNIRFSDFKPEWVSGELWHDLLGDDVNNLMHMPYTYELARNFSERQGLDKDICRKIGLVAISHDWGEAIVGDIALPDKTESDENEEAVAYQTICNDVFGETGADIANEVLPILYKEDEVLGDIFRAIEYAGYTNTALKARSVAGALVEGFIVPDSTRKQRIELEGNLMALYEEVRRGSFPTTKDYVKKYEAMRGILSI